MTRCEVAAGPWPFDTLPPVVEVAGGIFRRTRMAEPHPLCIAQYREHRARGSRHLHVHLDPSNPSGPAVWQIDHLDDWNPDAGAWAAFRHFFADHPLGRSLGFR